ncbi:uncharacterized protein [Periplaneta americana]|uniref:uncharacterized protein n=1 Tax=Periplaneta americana TaxID=6978 RepID=UPI0037E893A8
MLFNVKLSLHCLTGSVPTNSLINIRKAVETANTEYWHTFINNDYEDDVAIPHLEELPSVHTGPRTEEETDGIKVIYKSAHFTDSTSSEDGLINVRRCHSDGNITANRFTPWRRETVSEGNVIVYLLKL